MAAPVFVINLPRCKDRRKRIEQRLTQYKLSYTFVEAIDKGSELVKWYYDAECYNKRDRITTQGELACYLSHLKAIKAALSQYPKEAYYLILEDDALFIHDFITHYEKIPLDTGYDIISLFGLNFREGLPQSTASPGISYVYRENWGTWSTTGYLISNRYAHYVLDMYDRPLRYIPGKRVTSEIFIRNSPRGVYLDTPLVIEELLESLIQPSSDHQFKVLWYQKHITSDNYRDL